jgi:predicted DNA-binding transcriptional regulator YafY
MANVKNAAIREIIIDRCLRHPGGRTVQQIMKECNDALDLRGFRQVTSPNTIRQDFVDIANRWHQVIKCHRSGRYLYYSYKDQNFSIFNNPLSEEEIMKVYGAIEVMERFKGQAGFSWIEEVSAHLRVTLNMGKSPQTFISYDDNTQLRGMQHFALLHEYIRARQPIVVEYQPYNNPEPMEETVHPYFLKQYNSRWFVLGFNTKYDALTTFALDRIITIQKAPVNFIPNTRYDFKEYFKDVIGISIAAEGQEPEEILIEVDGQQYPYVSSKPMHTSQHLVRFTENGNAVIMLKVIDNFELRQLILSYGKRMTVLKPQHLREEIAIELQDILNNYQSAQID